MIHILRMRKGVPGVGRRLGRELAALGHEIQEVTCGNRPYTRPSEGDVVLNYGRSTVPVWFNTPEGYDAMPGVRVINYPYTVALCVDKLKTLTVLTEAGVPTLEWTISAVEAQQWNELDDMRVFARHTTVGKKGRGIEIIPKEFTGLWPVAPLYTKEYRKSYEFRVHVFDGQVIDITQKKKMSDAKVQARGYARNADVRNKANGWTFAHENAMDFPKVREVAIAAASALGMNFCGVDVLAKKNGDAVVCEVNSAPGMSKSRTLAAYVGAFDRAVRIWSQAW